LAFDNTGSVVSWCRCIGALTWLLLCVATFVTSPATAGFYDKAAKVPTTPEEWLPLALDGSARAQFNLGWAYEEGKKGVDKNLSEAAKWYGMAAANGLRRGILKYAEALEEGRGVGVDLEHAKLLYESINHALGVDRVIERQNAENFKVLEVNGNAARTQQGSIISSYARPYLDVKLVTNIQTLLKKIGYEVGKVDGVWGVGTLSAAQFFAKDFNYVIPVQVTNDVLLGLIHSLQDELVANPSLIAIEKVSSIYLDKSIVKEVQSALSDLDYSIGPVDGAMGAKSMKALHRFASDNNYEIPAPLTKEILLSVLSSLNEKINEMNVRAESIESQQSSHSIPSRASSYDTVPGGLGMGVGVALLIIFLVTLVIVIMRPKRVEVDTNKQTKNISLPDKMSEIDATFLDKPIEVLEHSSSVEKLSDASSSFVVSKSAKKQITFGQKIIRYCWLYIGLLIVGPLLLGKPLGALGMLSVSMIALPGLFGDLFYKIGIVRSDDRGSFVSIVIGFIVATLLAFIK